MVFCLFFFIACRQNTPDLPVEVVVSKDSSLTVNLAHLEHLYDEIVLPKGDTGGVVWIYCEAPDYRLVGDEDEGYTCVDDMARALVVYAMHHQLHGDNLSRRRVNQLARTITSMQADNGYFHNFLWPDNTINTVHRTSLAEANWWSWRALWALEVALAQNLLDGAAAASAKTACERLVSQVVQDFPADAPQRDTLIGECIFPNDLLGEGGAYDQSAVLVLGISLHIWRQQDTDVSAIQKVGRRLAKRLIDSQAADGRFPSWYEHWHAWGNLQAYTLLQPASLYVLESPNDLPDLESIQSDLRYYIRDRYSSALCSQTDPSTVPPRASGIGSCDSLPQPFPQIAYGQRPYVWAALAAHAQLPKSRVYLQLAEQTAAWFSGDNVAGVAMYDPATGRGYDGIIGPAKVNYNAGAESTIEALLSLLMLEAAERSSNGEQFDQQSSQN